MSVEPSSDDVVRDEEYVDDFEAANAVAEAAPTESESDPKSAAVEKGDDKEEVKIEEPAEKPEADTVSAPAEDAGRTESDGKTSEAGVTRAEAKSEAESEQKPSSKTYTFGLFDGDNEIADIVLPATATWEEFKSAASEHAKFQVGHFIYESSHDEVSCRSAADWKECLDYVEKAEGELHGKLEVDIFAIVTYTLELVQGDHKIGDIEVKSTASWEGFQQAAKEQLQTEVKGIRYDDDYGDKKEKGVMCENQENWEDVLDMMEVDEKHLKNRLKIQILSFTLQCYLKDEVVKTITVFPADGWADIAAQLRVIEGEPEAFEYDDDKGAAQECGSQAEWAKCFAVLRKKGTLEVELLDDDDDAGEPPELPSAEPAAAPAAPKPAEQTPVGGAKGQGKAGEGAKGGPGVSSGVLQKVLKGRAGIVKACKTHDDEGLGLVDTEVLAREVAKAGGCSAEAATELVTWTRSELRGAGKDQVDFELFFRRFRYVDAREKRLVEQVLGSAPLQAARLAVLNRPEIYTKILESEDSDAKKRPPVDAKKCEELLAQSKEKLMPGRQAKLLAANPGFADREGETDLRRLPKELVAVSTRQLHAASETQRVLLELIQSSDALEEECQQQDDAEPRTGLLAVDRFFRAVQAAGMDVRYATMVPDVIVAAGSLRDDDKVDYGGFIELELRRKVLLHRDGILKEMDERAAKDDGKKLSSVDLLQEVLKDRSQVWKMEPEEAALMASDVPGERFGLKEGRDARLHVEKLQFCDFVGEGVEPPSLDDAAPAIFKLYEHLVQKCISADKEDSGVLELDVFAEAMRGAGIEGKYVEIVTEALKDEMMYSVGWRELLEHRLVVLGHKEINDILEHWRNPERQKVRQRVMQHAGTVMLELAEEQEEGTVLLEHMEQALLKVLSEDKTAEKLVPSVIREVLHALPVRRQDGNLVVEPVELSYFRACNVQREMDEMAIKPLLRSRKGVLAECKARDKSKSGRIDARKLSQVLYQSKLPASAVDCLVAHADRTQDGRYVEYEAFLSHFAVVTKQEQHRLELLADDRLQRARAGLVEAEMRGELAGVSAAAGQPWMLLKKLKEKIAVEDGEGLALAVQAFADTQQGEPGSLRAEDLVDHLTLTVVDFEPADFQQEEPMAEKGKRPVVGGGENLTPAQKIWRDKILKPRKPGINDMLAFMKDMPLCVGLSPLREEHKSGRNLPSAALGGLGDFRALTIARDDSPTDMQNLVMASVYIKNGEGVPYFKSDSYEVLEQRARVCLVKVAEERFVGGAHVVPKSNKHGGKDGWVFSRKEEKGNPFMVRADTSMGLELYIELSLLCRKKGTATQGQQALAKGDVKELSCAYGCLPLDKETLPPPGKKTKKALDLFGGTPWAERHIQPGDCKAGGMFKRFMGKKMENKLHVELTVENPAKAAMLPHNMVCSAVCLEAIAQFRAIQKNAASLADPFTRPVQPDLVLTTFPVIMDSYDLMLEFATKWKDRQKNLSRWGKKPSTADKNKAFAGLVKEFYPLIHLDSANLPRNPDAGKNSALETRAKTLDSFRRMKKVTDMLEGNFNNFRYTPFKVDEFVAVV